MQWTSELVRLLFLQVAGLLSIWGAFSPRIGKVVAFLQWLAGDTTNWSKFWQMFGNQFQQGMAPMTAAHSGVRDPFEYVDQLAQATGGPKAGGNPTP